MKRSIVATLAGLLCAAPVFSQLPPTTVRSPDGQVSLSVGVNGEGHLTWSVERKGEVLVAPSALRLRLKEGDVSSVNVDPRGKWPRSVDTVQKLVATKAAEARDCFNELITLGCPACRAWQMSPKVRNTR